jgi:alpha-L-fucosidase
VPNSSLVLPTPAQAAWSDAEVGVIIHCDMQVFEPGYEFRRRWGYTPDPSVFNPSDLDTDQWIEAARSAGATYAVLVAKHCSGFSLWPTRAHAYSVASSPWRGGKGDVVADFMRSCAKHGLKPGIYASASCNAFLRVDNPGKVLVDDPAFLAEYSARLEWQSGRNARWADEAEQRRYNQVVETQLAELWGNYGRLFEIWFDGGVLPPEQGGPAIVPLMRRMQPEAVVFGGPPGWPSLARFVGNERGEPPDPFWNTTSNLEAFDGTTEVAGLGGSPDGQVWSCGEADMPNRCQLRAFQGGWFWRTGDDQHLYSLDHLTERWFRSVGGNCNLLLGMVIDPSGRVPAADCQRFAEFGNRIRRIKDGQVAQVAGAGRELVLPLPAGRAPTVLNLQEDLTQGERVRRFVVEAATPRGWEVVWRGTGIGHRRLQRVAPIHASALRLRVLECAAEPRIRAFAAWEAPAELCAAPLDVAQRHRPAIRRDAAGMVVLSCPDPNLLIRYTLDGSEPGAASPLYAGPFPLSAGGTVKAFTCVNDRSRSDTVTAVLGVDRSGWKVVSVTFDSPYANGGHAGVAHLLNDDPAYYWHTYHADRARSAPPHAVVLDMGRTLAVDGFTILPRDREGAPDGYVFELSDDGVVWRPAASGRIEGLYQDAGLRHIPLARPQPARFLRFTATHTLDDLPYVVVAGIGVTVAPGA